METSGTSVDEDGEDVDVLQRHDIDLRRLIQKKGYFGIKHRRLDLIYEER